MVMQINSAPAPRADSSSGDLNDNLLAIAMEYRQSLGSPSSSCSSSPSKSSTPRAAAPRAAANPSPSSNRSDSNDNLLAAAMVCPRLPTKVGLDSLNYEKRSRLFCSGTPLPEMRGGCPANKILLCFVFHVGWWYHPFLRDPNLGAVWPL